MNIPYVPCLVDRAAVGSSVSESDCAIVIDSVDNVGTLILGFPVLALLMLLNHHSIVEFVLMGFTLRVFPLVVLGDNPLATLSYILPVRFKAYVVNRVAIKHKLGWRSAHGGVDCGTHREADSTEDTVPRSVGEVFHGLDSLRGNQVVDGLMSSLDH